MGRYMDDTSTQERGQFERRMRITPLDLRQQRFKAAMRGFDKTEVVAFLTEAAASLTLARGLAARGDTAAALAALARRRYYQPLPVFVLAFRREAARLSR